MSSDVADRLKPSPKGVPWVGHPLFWVALFALILGAVGLRVTMAKKPEPPPVLLSLPEFRFQNQDDVAFGTTELAGHVYLADFIFTRCPTVCPKMTEHMASLQERLRELGPRVQLVSFSVDPAFDTPPRLKAYAQAHHVNSRRWSFLTGPTDAMQKTVVEGFKIALTHEGRDDAPASATPPAETDFMSIVHGSQFVLVDGRARIRGFYDSNDPAALEQLVRDTGTLANARD